MPDDPKERESEQFIRFKAAMKQIVAVKKADIERDLPKMFRERKASKKPAAKKTKT